MARGLPAAALTAALATAFVSLGAARAEPNQARARALHTEGLEAFRLARYDAAIDAFKAAYELSPVPGLLFNIAETYRVKGFGSCGQALDYYRRYRDAEEPAVAAEREVDARIEEMARCAERERPAAAPQPAVSRSAPSRPSAITGAIEPAPRPRHRPLAWALIGTGGAALVAGAITGVLVLQKQSSLEEDCPDGACPPSLRGEVESYDRLKVVGTVGLVAGSVCAGAGLILFWVGRPRPPARRAALSPWTDLTAVGVRGWF